MKVVFLGTGTSVGIPVIACDCPVCLSQDPKNRRLRSSIYMEAGGVHVVVDTGPDFRQQALVNRIPRVDAVLFTHAHADHVFGFDDIRRFNTIQDGIIPAYGSQSTVEDLLRIFNYVQKEKVVGFYRPLTEFIVVSRPFQIGDLWVEPLEVVHGQKTTYGYLFREGSRTFGYVPDCRELADEVVARLKGVDVMVLDALRHTPHKTHCTVVESLAILKKIGAKKSFMIHMCHDLDHNGTEALLPAGMHLSYDGMVLQW